MDIFKILSGATAPIAQWAIGIAIGGMAIKWLSDQISRIRNTIYLSVNSKISSIDDPDLKEMVRFAIRYSAKRFPDVSGDEKMLMVIKAVQDATPNWIISDEQIKTIIQSEYNSLKDQLQKI